MPRSLQQKSRRRFFGMVGGLAAARLLGRARAARGAEAAPAPVRVGIAGLSHSHVHGLLGRTGRGDVQIVGIAEANRELALRYSRRHGFAMDLVSDTLEALLERARPQVVCAFGPIREHLAVVEACAPRGIHVMVEKPLAVSLEHARRMARLAEANRVLLLTNYETTWYGSNRRLHELVVRDGAIGGIRKIVVHDGHAGPVAIGVEPEFLAWLTDPEQNGAGALMDFGCYGADLATWLMGGRRPLSVTAVTQQLQPKLYPKVDDEATIVLTYPDAQAILQASWNWPFGRKDTHVYGERGYVLAQDATRLRLRLAGPETEEVAPPPPAPDDEAFAHLAAAVRGRVEEGPAGPSSLATNLVAMEILEAARDSARSGRTVVLAAR